MSPSLSDPQRELDSCGIGFVADAHGRASRAIVDLALEALARVRHRGAFAADRRTGDGAGLLLPIPAALLPGAWCGLAMVFLRDETARSGIEAACRAEGLGVLGWRPVPVDASALGDDARAEAPLIEQLVLLRPLGSSADEAELRAYRARRRAERVGGAYVVSLSFRTVTYKALCAADQLAAFYGDLRDRRVAVPFAVFHQRFSTNTKSSWERAQPFRLLCHNGEINTIEGNAAWLRAREAELGGLVLEAGGSDSGMLDNALELLVRGGRDIRHAVSMLIPEAWQGDPELDEDVHAFYRHHAGLVEPWDGPAGVVFTDGRLVGAALDRNGLRPLRYAICDDGLVACASEAGAVPLPAGRRVRRGKLGPGGMLVIDPARFGVEHGAEIRRRLARRRPYARWLASKRVPLGAGNAAESPAEDLTPRQIAAGYTREDLSLLLRPIAADAHEPTSSMGDDTALPPLAGRARPLFSYFRQRFAQVTNPPLDHLRERSVMSLRTLLGPRQPLLADGPGPPALELESFFLYPDAVAGLEANALDATLASRESLADACGRLGQQAVRVVAEGAQIVVLTDERSGPDRPAVPALLATGVVHRCLGEAGLRTLASIVVSSDEPREAHHVACLLGYGADAVCPSLALQTVEVLAAGDKIGGDRPSPAVAQSRFRAAVEDGVLKVMSKMGIADVASYRGAQLFEVLGLADEVVDTCFRGTPSRIGGVGFDELERECRDRVASAYGDVPQLANPGYVKFRKGGEPHATTPEVVDSLQETVAAHALRAAVSHGGWEQYKRFAVIVDSRPPLALRDLFDLVPAGPPVPLDQVEPAASVVRRFSGGAMSHGALSAEAHETVAIALNRLGARSNSGEGGEARDRFGTDRSSAIKQVASARFGVTPEYLVHAEELQIKIAQGSKPGEGGQLPGHKVTVEIARLRHTEPGIALISPPPHHDIYSIEDLAQLVFDLRQVNPRADVSVKLVSEPGVGLVAAGVVKALADVVHVAGADGGTGASPLTSIKNAGAPWELGLAETQQTLVANGLRGRVRVRVDGGIKTGRDVLVAALLGADEVSFGTALLIAEGCLLVRSCHIDTCPVGIASQRPELRAKFGGTPEMVAAYLLYVADDVRRRLAALGLRTLDEAVGRVELLRPRAADDDRAASLDVAALLAPPGEGPRRYVGQVPPAVDGGALGERLALDAGQVLDEARIVELAAPISNSDRAVGARLGGLIARRHGEAPPPGRVRARYEGVAGQSFGAFLAPGVELALTGEANDYVGKGMGGGRIVIRPPGDDAGDPVLVGNTVLYGATGGELFCAGRAGERFAVRNSGAVAVVEGVGDHGCEYMTAGVVVVLGEVGRNFGAGMTGGLAYVLDPDALLDRRLNGELVVAGPPSEADLAEIHALLERHLRFTESARASSVLEDWPRAAAGFQRVAPRTQVGVLAGAAEAAAL